VAKQKPTRPRAARRAESPSHEPTRQKVARAAIGHEATATPSREKVKLTLTVFLDREQAERLTARAIREGKNLEGLVAEILEGEAAAGGDEDR
jgi:hypothetical protein